MSIIERAALRLSEDDVKESGGELEYWIENDAISASMRNSEALLFQENGTAREANIDLAKLRAAGFLTPDTPYISFAEQYRLIKRPLLMKASVNGNPIRSEATGAGKNIVMVTSALPGEGKTFTAINLAISIATERDRTVLLVDMDVAKGDIARQLGIDSELGLSSLLVEKTTSLKDVLVKTNIAKLSILPAGAPYRDYTELVASQVMRKLLVSLAKRSKERVVILDSPPLLASSGASVLAHLAGQIVVVVEAGRTSHAILREALQLLAPGSDVSMILNKDGLSSRSRYGYYDGYGYPNHP